jgi:hypothetical protein
MSEQETLLYSEVMMILRWYETWNLALRKESNLKAFQSNVLRKIF